MFYNVAQGTTNHLGKLVAEHSVIAEYAGRAHHIPAHRWRGAAGEIDLIFADGNVLILIEVKKRRNLSHTQQKRIYRRHRISCRYRPLFGNKYAL